MASITNSILLTILPIVLTKVLLIKKGPHYSTAIVNKITLFNKNYGLIPNQSSHFAAHTRADEFQLYSK